MYKVKGLKFSILIPLYLSSSLGVGMASAQTPEDRSSAGIEEITVTAQKRSAGIQEVPATINAFTQEDLSNRQINGLEDLLTRVPSLDVGYQFGSNTVTLRGISTNITSGLEDPSVAVHVNGVYQSRARSLNLAQMDLERIEVLSGPQGTLYGRNATGGVINYVLRGPTDEFEAEVTGRVGNYERHAVEGYISGPINDDLGYRIAGIWDNRDKGYTKNLLAGAPKDRFEENEVTGVRGVLAFEPAESLRIDVEGSYSHARGSFQPTALAPSISPAIGALLGEQSFRPREVYADYPSKNDTKDYGASVTTTWDINDAVQLKSISAYQKYDNTMNIDQEASRNVLFTVLNENRSETYTQEFNLLVDSLDGRLESTFGVYYFDDQIEQRTGAFSVLFSPADTRAFFAEVDQDATSLAFFTDQTFRVTDRLRLIAGVRYNIDEKETTQQVTFGTFPTCSSETGSTDHRFTEWTPKAGFQYDLADSTMLYATYQEGFKAGGVAGGTCGDDYEPEEIEGGEIGIKTEFADNRIRLNIAGYYYDYSNLQVQKNTEGFVVDVTNAAESRIKGVEASLEAVITERLKLDMAAMSQSAKYTDYVNWISSDQI